MTLRPGTVLSLVLVPVLMLKEEVAGILGSPELPGLGVLLLRWGGVGPHLHYSRWLGVQKTGMHLLLRNSVSTSFQICITHYRSCLVSESPGLVGPNREMPGFMHQWHLHLFKSQNHVSLLKRIPYSCFVSWLLPSPASAHTGVPPPASPSRLTIDFLAGSKGQRCCHSPEYSEPLGPTEDYKPEFEPTRSRGLQHSLPNQFFKIVVPMGRQSKARQQLECGQPEVISKMCLFPARREPVRAK